MEKSMQTRKTQVRGSTSWLSPLNVRDSISASILPNRMDCAPRQPLSAQ